MTTSLSSGKAAYRSTKEIAATVRAELKQQLPDWKFSVRIQTYSGGSSITLSLMSGPEQVAKGESFGNDVVLLPFKGYAQLNHYQLERTPFHTPIPFWCNGVVLTSIGWEVLKRANEILSIEHWDKSDAQSDYFCCNFYRHVQIGQWDRPYEVKEKK